MILREELPFTNVVAGSTATLVLPPGPTYERLVLQLGGTTMTKALMTGIRLKMNGKTILDTTGTVMDKMNTYEGLAVDANFLVLDFSEITARDQVGQSISALGTAAGVANLSLEIDIGGGAVAPTIKAYSWLSAPKAVSVISKLLKYPTSFSAAGTQSIRIPFGAQGGSLIKRIYFDSANMTGAEIKMNGISIHKSTKAVNDFIGKDNKRVPQTGLYVVDFVVDGNMTEMLNTVPATSLEVWVTLSAADTVNTYVEYVDPLGNL